MSEFFRIRSTPRVQRLGILSLARECHRAENEDDDVCLMEIMDEVQRRGIYPEPFMEAYRMVWAEFAKQERQP